MGNARIARIGDKFYDLRTPNKSFLQVALDLRQLGIKNYYFMLEICDISLVNVDPYAVDPKTGHTVLSRDQITRIMAECLKNPWYFLREISRIPDPGGSSVPYLANRGNIAQAWCIWKGLDSWLCLPRQQGKTQSALAFQVWMYSFGTTNSSFIFINKDGENAKTNLRRMTEQIDLLPEYLRFESIIDEETGVRTKAVKNATKIAHPVNGNSVIVKSKATSYDMALSLARGLTSPVQHFDEPEFTAHIKTIISNSVSTFETAASRAKANGAMYGRIFTCTPGDLGTSMGMEAQEILDKSAKWSETLYDKTDEQIEEYLLSQGEDCNRILYIEYHYYQIGKTEKWLKEISAKIGDPLVVRREILLQRLHGSSMSPYNQEDIEYIVETEQKPIDEIWIMDYFKFDIYRKLDKKIPYIMSVDCSTGTNGDNNAITILNPYTLEPDAEFECSYIGETKFEQLIIEMVLQYIPRAIVCIERNSVGDGIIDHLLHSKISGRIYYDKAKDLQQETMNQNESTAESMLRHQAKMKTFYGVWTGSTSRPTMFSILSRHVNEYKEKFKTHNIIRDLSRLVKTSSGKIEAGAGFHDDSIMSYLIGLYVYYHGNNLAVFGFVKGDEMEETLNNGMKRPEEIDTSLVDPQLVAAVKRHEELEAAPDWNEILRQTMLKSQQESLKLFKKGLVNNELYANTPEEILEDSYDEGYIGMDFFSEINGL